MSSDSVSGSRVQLLRNSNIEEVKSYLSEELSHQNIVREKLLNPLRMMDRIVETIASKLAHRQEMIEGDERTLEFVAENMAMWSTSLRQDALNYKQRVAHQQNQMRQRCSDFIAKDLSPLNIKAIVNASILSNSFRTDVLLEMETTLFDTKAEFRDLLAKSARQQQRSVMQYVGERTRQHQSKIMGSVNVFAGDEAAEQKHLSVIDRDINLLLSDFKPAREAEELTRPVSLSGVFGAASALGGAVGAGLCWLGMQDAMLASACAVAGVGGSSLFMWKRNSLKDDLDARLKEFSDRFDTIMSHHLINELERTQKRISDSIRPYETFVQLEKGKINDMQKSLEKVKKEINDIKSQI